MKPYLLFIILAFVTVNARCQSSNPVDIQVKDYLDQHRRDWDDMNVPYSDGKVLYDIIIKNNYQSALEIGTSTGHSSIWIAWALSKTGGKLTTIEINERRHKEALKNIEEAGLSDYVDARLADAHKLVKELEGPFDFVFSDADKDWYLQYFKDVDPKLKQGGCFTAHNVRNGFGGTKEFLDHVSKLPEYTTTVDNSSNSGISISYKK